MTCKISCQVGKCKSLEMRGGNVFGSETREKWFWEVETASRKIVVLSKEKKEGGRGRIYLVKIHLLKRKISNFTRIHYFALFSSRYTLRIVQILRRTNKIHSPLVHRIFDIPEERRISTVSLQFFFSLFFFSSFFHFLLWLVLGGERLLTRRLARDCSTFLTNFSM